MLERYRCELRNVPIDRAAAVFFPAASSAKSTTMYARCLVLRGTRHVQLQYQKGCNKCHTVGSALGHHLPWVHSD